MSEIVFSEKELGDYLRDNGPHHVLKCYGGEAAEVIPASRALVNGQITRSFGIYSSVSGPLKFAVDNNRLFFQIDMRVVPRQSKNRRMEKKRDGRSNRHSETLRHAVWQAMIKAGNPGMKPKDVMIAIKSNPLFSDRSLNNIRDALILSLEKGEVSRSLGAKSTYGYRYFAVENKEPAFSLYHNRKRKTDAMLESRSLIVAKGIKQLDKLHDWFKSKAVATAAGSERKLLWHVYNSWRDMGLLEYDDRYIRWKLTPAGVEHVLKLTRKLK